MALNIKDPETDVLVRRLADLTKEPITTAVRKAVEERLQREERVRKKATYEELMAIIDEIASQATIDDRSPDEIIGYDENGLPS